MSDRGPTRGRTWPQRALIAVNVLALVAAAATAGALAYSNDRVGQIERYVFDEGVLANDELTPGDPQNILLVGVDDGTDALGSAGQARALGSKLTDTIMVARIDPATASASVLSFPRDLLVEIPGHTSRSRINSAFETGGAQLLVQTIRQNFGIPIHHYLQVDFAGFQQLVDVVGGIPVHFPRPVRSRSSVELDIPAAGCWVLGPRQALGFARARKDYQVQDADGVWHTDRGGDYSRVERQQLFIQLAMQQAIAKGATNVNTLRRLIDLGVGSVTIDDALEPDALVDLSRSFRSFDPTDLETHTLPVDEAPRGGPAYLYLREDEAEATLAHFRGDAASVPSIPVEDITVQVRNGTGTPNEATDVTGLLREVGFTTTVPGPDLEPSFPTVIQHAPGAEAEAMVVASWLGADALYAVEDLPEGLDVVVMTGAGWDGVREVPRPLEEVPAPTTSTTTTPDLDGEDEVGDGTAEDDEGAVSDDDASSSEMPPSLVDDPSDPAFFRAEPPPPGASCQPTP